MSFIKQLSIAKQLSILVGCSLISTLLLTALAWTRIDQVYKGTNYGNANVVPTLNLLGQVSDAAAMIRARSWQSAIFTDERRRGKIEASQNEALSQIGVLMDKYEQEYMSFDTPEQLVEDKALVASIRSTLVDLRDVVMQSRTLMRQGKQTEGAELLWSNVSKLMGLQKGVSALREFNQKLGAAGAKTAADLKFSTNVTMMVVGGLVTVLLLWMGLAVANAIRGPVEEAVHVAEKIADGQIGNRLAVEGRDNEVGRLLHALQAMDDRLCEIVSSVTDTAESVGSAARQIAQGNDDLSSRTQEQASALQETAATMEQMTATVKHNSDNAHQADQLGRQARNQADSSTDVVQRAVGAMQDINTASRKISDIINVIDEIAFQTNLLALNAAVEAARAGEQGRGFAVVATEVRNLAQRSASAAKEIKTLINDSVAKVDVGTSLVNASGKALADIVGDVKRVTDIVAEIAAASTEQSSGIDQINHAVTQMDTTTQQNAALVEEAASASKSMEQQAQEMVQRVGFFKIEGRERRLSSMGQGAASRPAAAPRPAVAKVASAPSMPKRAVGGESWSEF